jgi:hypothetical protein
MMKKSMLFCKKIKLNRATEKKKSKFQSRLDDYMRTQAQAKTQEKRSSFQFSIGSFQFWIHKLTV